LALQPAIGISPLLPSISASEVAIMMLHAWHHPGHRPLAQRSAQQLPQQPGRFRWASHKPLHGTLQPRRAPSIAARASQEPNPYEGLVGGSPA
jgi:hypothetical protein